MQGLEERCASCGQKKPDLGEITLASKMGWWLERREAAPSSQPGGQAPGGQAQSALVFEWTCPQCVARRRR